MWVFQTCHHVIVTIQGSQHLLNSYCKLKSECNNVIWKSPSSTVWAQRRALCDLLEQKWWTIYLPLPFPSAREVSDLSVLKALKDGHVFHCHLFIANVKLFPVFKRAPYWPAAPAVACHASWQAVHLSDTSEKTAVAKNVLSSSSIPNPPVITDPYRHLAQILYETYEHYTKD